MRLAKYNKVDPNKLYTREEASKAIGISSLTFKKHFMENDEFVKKAKQHIKETAQAFYKGSAINDRIEKLMQIQTGILDSKNFKSK